MLTFNLKDKLHNIKAEYPNNALVNESCDIHLQKLNSYTDFQILESTLNDLSKYAYLPAIEDAIKECTDIANTNFNKYVVNTAMNKLTHQGDNISIAVVEQLKEIEKLPEAEILETVKSLSQYDFLSPMLEMRQTILSKTNNVTPNSNFNITKSYSPVMTIAENKNLFNFEGKYFVVDSIDESIEEYVGKVEPNFQRNVNLINNCAIEENKVTYNFNNKLFSTNGTTFTINGVTINESELFQKLNWEVGVGQMEVAKGLYDIHENFNQVMELDFATKVQNKFNNKNQSVTLFKTSNNMYVLENNSYTGAYKFTADNNTNTISSIFETKIGFNINESLQEFKDLQNADLLEAKSNKDKLITKLTFLAEQLDEVANNESLNESKESILEMLKQEVKEAKLELRQLQEKLKQTVTESLEDEGYVKATVLKPYNGLSKNETVWVNAEEMTSKGDSELISVKNKTGTDLKLQKRILKVQ